MPSEKVASEQIEDILAMLNEMGINVVETEEDEEIESAELVGVIPKTLAKSKPKEPVERTDDPVTGH
jgi:RNA polymerase primary sigma factor